ncbi:MAG: Fe-S cluster assembly protein SufD [Actinomycetota bacterium]
MKPLSHFDIAASSAAGEHDPSWRSGLRSAGLDAFSRADLPSSAEEIWRYVDLDFSFDDYVPASGSRAALDPDPLLSGIDSPIAVRVVDGAFDGADYEGEGLAVASLARAARDHSDTVEEAFVRVGVAADQDIFAAGMAAFGGDGVFVHAARTVPARQTVAVSLEAVTDDVASFPGIVVVAEDQADVSIVVHLRSAPETRALVVPQFAVSIGDGARVSLTLVQDLGYGARSIGSLRAEVGADATFRFGEIGLGARHARLHLDVGLEGRGSSANVVGAYFGEQNQTLDYRYFMRHVGTNTRSDMFLKGAVEDVARSVFTGMIRIEETGQKTEAYQTNRNLILSEGASAQSVPNLEILANDVRCGHGSTVGPLDAEQRYYLMSRGLEPSRADRLQVRGFFDEALAKLPHPELAGEISTRINHKYETAQAEGRV